MTLSKKLYDTLAIKVNATDTNIPSTSELVTKTQYDSDKESLEKKFDDMDKKIPNTSGLDNKTGYNTKIDMADIESRIPSITGVVTTASLSTKTTGIENTISDITNQQQVSMDTKAAEVKNKIPDITNSATKAALHAKVTEIENKTPDTAGFIATPGFK